ncbi:hypothetical protein EVAR_64076_1 [Eumeta japonica]|uniref:Uncharacterized protein n=1 Tax=Eumeta variegata TaxID=151549 RepID=A0A4C1ZA18_EUMVA|nr:hypothetical protein EVAR_64076_1 [Eumeta japonica]
MAFTAIKYAIMRYCWGVCRGGLEAALKLYSETYRDIQQPPSPQRIPHPRQRHISRRRDNRIDLKTQSLSTGLPSHACDSICRPLPDKGVGALKRNEDNPKCTTLPSPGSHYIMKAACRYKKIARTQVTGILM